jgi:hypothetical protein
VGTTTRLVAIVIVAALVASACAGGRVEQPPGDAAAVAPPAPATSQPDSTRNPAQPTAAAEYRAAIDPGDFVRVVDNRFLPMMPGMTHVYEGEGERVEVTVTHDTRVVQGVVTVVVVDRVFRGEELIEESVDWFAQDRWGNVWYFGEARADYEDGVRVSTDGSWEAGVNGAQPGIAMLGEPRGGDVYRSEYLPGEAEDMSRVESLGERWQVPYGSFSEVLITRDWSPLDPGALELKMYAPGVGLIVDRSESGSEASELIEIRAS